MDLITAAEQFSDALRRCAKLALVNKMKSIEWTTPYGHYVRIASIADNLWLSIAKGNYFGVEQEGFWVGFECQKFSQSREIVSDLVKNLNRKICLTTLAVDGAEWPANGADHLVAERYFEAEHENGLRSTDPFFGFGIYFLPGVDFNLLVAMSFVFEVLNANGYETLLEVDDAGRDIAAIEIGNKTATREQLIQARLGQGVYREALMKRWDRKCAVLGISQPEVLRASHVVAFANCANDDERLDPSNGLLLSAHLDALFDRYLITFSNDGSLILAEELSHQRELKTLLGSRLREKPDKKLAAYLTRHRNQFHALHDPSNGAGE